MAERLILDTVLTANVIYVAVPYGSSPITGGTNFSGLSVVGEQELGVADSGHDFFELQAGGFVSEPDAIGVLRYGYYIPASGGELDFFELGFEPIRRGGTSRQVDGVPQGRNLAVRVRWKSPGVSWIIHFS